MKKIFLFLLVIVVFAACGGNGDVEEQVREPEVRINWHELEPEEPWLPIEFGEGETTFMVDVITNDGHYSWWEISTDADTVGAALSEIGFIRGDDTSLGLFVTSVVGIEARDGEWWSFYIGSDQSVTGVDSTYIEPGQIYAFIIKD